jgi:hypothetical protein
MQQHQQQMARQGAIGMPQTTGAPISIAAAMKKLPSALNVPQIRVVQRQPPSPCDSHLDCNHTFRTSDFPTLIANADSYQRPNQSHPRSTFCQRVRRAVVFLYPYSATRVCDSLH